MSNPHGSTAFPTQPVVAFTPPAPEVLGGLLPHFEIHSLIAVGGMGAVYAGMQRDLERPVAIKILPPEAARDVESIERFRTEAKAMARLSHAHIPVIFDFDVVEDYCLLVMELIEGDNVVTLIERNELPPLDALRIFAEVCDAIHFAHGRGIVHGDIKPGNILLNGEGHAKLVDFGLARLMVGEAKDDLKWTPMGTPEYAAPELYDRHASPDHRADIYSLGVVLYEMLTGQPPSGAFELPASGLKLDSRVDVIIAKCMEADPAARFQTAAEVRQIACDILDGRRAPLAWKFATPTRRTAHHGLPSPSLAAPLAGATRQRRATTPVNPQRQHGFRPYKIVCLSIVLIAVVAALVYLASKSDRKPPILQPTEGFR